jgi:hypothetical protein
MHEPPEYFSECKPARCPRCGADTVVEIVWGLPAPGVWTEALEGNIVLGGCERGDCDPSWKCTRCNVDVYREELRGRFTDDKEAF